MEQDGNIQYEDCGTNGEMFPCIGVCCNKDKSMFKASYTIVCPYCRIFISLPYGPSLKTVTIIECCKFGYGRRITELPDKLTDRL
ncbi:MAG TPA: hypothetical protein GXX14_02615 [Clostridiaceae bacterium]|nr:hypothetical protein [Clostridiaceae bacterium]